MARRARSTEKEGAGFQVFTVRMPEDLHHALRVVAADTNQTVNRLLTDIVREWWERNPNRRRVEEFTKARPREGTRKG